MSEPKEDLSLEELNDFAHQLMRSVKFHDAMLSDLLQMMVALDPGAIDMLRTDAAKNLSRVHATRYTDPMADEHEDYWRHRFLMLDKVLARAGCFYQGAEVINLADVVRMPRT